MAYQLAQMNLAVLKAPLDSPQLAGFVAELGRINALAESTPGFVWRLQDDAGDATALRPAGDDTLVNMSVWQDLAALRRFVYASEHVEILRRRREWFVQSGETRLVLWWTLAGQIPSVEEGLAKLDLLRTQGPTREAFTFAAQFPPPVAAP
jgi:heme-degrading monooxygenase HmoA